MADNAILPATGQAVATDEVIHSGDTAQVQLVRVVTVNGPEGSKTVSVTDPLLNIDADLGGPPTAAAPADGTGDYPIIAGVKRLALGMAQALTNWTTLLARIPAALGQGTMAQSLRVVLASDQTPVPTAGTVPTASGTITAQNTVPNGVAPAGSAVEIVLAGATSISVQTTGIYTGALSLQVTLDGTRWETVTGAVVTNMLSGVAAATIASATVGVFTAPVHGALRARITCLAAITGTATVTLRGLPAPTVLYMVQPTAANMNVTATGAVSATVGTSITGGTISPLTVAGASAEASAARTATGNSAAAITNASGRNAHFTFNVTAATGTTPTLVVRVQVQDPVSSGWVDLPGAVTGTITGSGTTLITVNNLPRTYRFAWVIGGTTPSFTFSVGILPII